MFPQMITEENTDRQSELPSLRIEKTNNIWAYLKNGSLLVKSDNLVSLFMFAVFSNALIETLSARS